VKATPWVVIEAFVDVTVAIWLQTWCKHSPRLHQLIPRSRSASILLLGVRAKGKETTAR
jgi:hypothetical protein